VPEGHLGLPDAPAEQHLLVAAERGEVDEPGLDVLHLDSELLDRADARHHGGRLALDGLRELGELARRQPTAVPADGEQRLRPASVRRRERAAMLDHSLGQRTHVGERPIRLLGREDALGHAGMIVGLVSAGQRPAGGVDLAELDAVTIDGYGTLLTLRDPIGHLDRALRAHGVERPASEIERGFDAEVRYYAREKLGGRDAASVATLRAGCAGAFLGELGLDLDREQFAPALAFEFDVLPGVRRALALLAAHGLALAVVADWDFSLHEQLRLHGLDRWFAAVVLSAELGAAKPEPAPFRTALERLGVEPARALHVGDDEVDEQGAAAAGMRFAPAPLTSLLGAAG